MQPESNGWSIRSSLFLLGLMVSAPFLDPRHFAPIPSFHGEWLAAALGLGACIALVTGGAVRNLAVPRIVMVPLGLIAIAMVQLAVQQPTYPGQTIVFMLYLAWAAMLALLGRALAHTIGLKRLATALAWGLLIGGLCSAITGFLQFAKAGSLQGLVLPWNSVVGNVGQANNFADHLWLATAAALYLFAEKRLGRGIFLLAAAVLIGASLLSGSRSVFFYCAALLALAFLWRHDNPPARQLFIGALALLGLVAGLQLLLGGTDPILGYKTMTGMERLAATTASPGGSVRLEDWQAALDAFSSAPLLGIGAGQFAWHMFGIADRLALPMGVPVAEHAHNIGLQLLAEFGLFALLLVAAGLLAWLVRLPRRERTAEHWLILALVAVMMIHSQLEYPLWYAFFLGPFALLLGAGDDRAFELQAPRLVRIALGGMMLLGAVFLAGALADYAVLRGGMFAPRQAAAQELQMRSGLSEVRRNILFTAHVDLQLAIAMPLPGEPRTDKIRLCDDAIRFNPARRAVFKCALLLALDGQAEKSDVLWRQSIAAFPDELPGLINRLRDMPEAKNGGPFAPLLGHAEKKLAELRAHGLPEPEAPASSTRSP